MEKMIDKNMEVPGKIQRSDIVWTDGLGDKINLHGTVKGERYNRLPLDFPILKGAGKTTAGVRARFITNSPFIAIRSQFLSTYAPTISPLLATAGFDLYKRSDDGKEVFVNSFRPPEDAKGVGYESLINVSGQEACYTINFPQFTQINSFEVGIKEGSFIKKAPDYDLKPVVYYGSSITQGAASSRPGMAYNAIISQQLGIDYINLGFAGAAKGEQEIADYVATLDMSVFVLDYQHNSYDLKDLEEKHYNFYKTVRAKNPDLPIIMVSAPSGAKKSWLVEGRELIKAYYEKGLSEGDKNLYHVEGGNLYDGPLMMSCTADNCHPNDLGFFRMAKGIGEAVATALGRKCDL